MALFAGVAVLVGACASSSSGPSGGTATPSGASKAIYGGTITFGLENDVSNLDPMLSGLFVDRNIHYAMYDSLVRVSPKGEILPWLAEKWTTSTDGKQVTFTLRQGVKYHDGTPFDAASVKWNIERYKTGKGSLRTGDLSLVDTVDAVDANTVRFNLKQAFSPLLGALVDRAGMMVSQKVVDAMGTDFTLKPFKAGTGPFILTEAVKNDHYTLEKNPDWWGKDAAGNKLPFLDKVIVKPILDADVALTNLRTGNVQVLNRLNGKDVPVVKTDPTLTYAEVGSFAWNSLVPNEAPGFIFSDRNLVKAVSMALDREEIVKNGPAAGVGLPGWGPLTPAHFAYDPSFKPWPKADPDAAKKLVTASGKAPLKFELLVSSGDPATLQLAQLIQAQLAKADITAEIKTQLFNDIVTLQQAHKHLGMTLINWSGRLDPDGNTYDFVVTGGAQNDTSYSNAKVDDLMKAQRVEPDTAKRKTMLTEAQRIYVVDDPARIWYSFGVSPLVTVKAVTGMESYPDRIARFQAAQLAK
ncbi:MAG: ABC transporter substrate-binding protein [Chloroflexota bacterium]|nr:ABC transporter substrate-binding protein [Chloroflexota bacterium]